MQGPLEGMGSDKLAGVELYLRLPGQAQLLPALERTDTNKARGFTTDSGTRPPSAVQTKTVQALVGPLLSILGEKFKRPPSQLIEMCETPLERRKRKKEREKQVEDALRERENAVALLEYELSAEKVWGAGKSLAQQQRDHLLYREPWSSATARAARSTRKPRAAQSARNIRSTCDSATGAAFKTAVGLGEGDYWNLLRGSLQERVQAKEYDVKKLHFYADLILKVCVSPDGGGVHVCQCSCVSFRFHLLSACLFSA